MQKMSSQSIMEHCQTSLACLSAGTYKLEVLSFNPRNEEISASNLTWMGGRGVKPIPCN